jgi:hypothetical protein
MLSGADRAAAMLHFFDVRRTTSLARKPTLVTEGNDMTRLSQPSPVARNHHDQAFLNYRMAVVREMPDSAYKRALLQAIEKRRQALGRTTRY